MPVSARSANYLIGAANPSVASGPLLAVRAGTYSIEAGDEGFTGWHSHDLHQLEYAFQGVAEVETATARYLLPPQQAVWIPAGVEHCSTLRRVRGVSVFFHPSMGLPAGDRVRILAAAPVIQEMVRYALRWPIGRISSDPTADAFFEALAHLVVEWLEQETPLRLPTARDPLVASAMTHTNENLSDVTLSGVCAAVGSSERSLRRAFVTDVGMSWREYVQESRMLKAMALLAGENQNMLAVALAVGFQSVSAFSRAFLRHTGETPSAYRRRVRIEPVATRPLDEQIAAPSDAAIRQWSHLMDEPPTPRG